MKRYYGFAGVGLALDLPDGEDFSEGRELPVFACEPRAGMTDVTVRIADRLIMPEGKIRFGQNKDDTNDDNQTKYNEK